MMGDCYRALLVVSLLGLMLTLGVAQVAQATCHCPRCWLP